MGVLGRALGTKKGNKRKINDESDESTESYDIEEVLKKQKDLEVTIYPDQNKSGEQLRGLFLRRCGKMKLATTLKLPGVFPKVV